MKQLLGAVFLAHYQRQQKVRKSVSSIRGPRYFGPSKMSFIDLLKHSLSIITVFKSTVLIRSIIFLAVYIFLVLKYISIITLISSSLGYSNDHFGLCSLET